MATARPPAGGADQTIRKDAEISNKVLDVRASKGAAGMFAARIPITAPKETMQAALYYAHDVAVEGLKLGMSSASVESSGGAAGGIAAVEFYDPRTDTQAMFRPADSSVKDQQTSEDTGCTFTMRGEQVSMSDLVESVSLEHSVCQQSDVCSSTSTEETFNGSDRRTDLVETAESHLHDDIRLSGKYIIAFGSKARPAIVERLNLATTECSIDRVASKFLHEHGGRHSCGTAVVNNKMYVVGGCCGSLSYSSTLVYNPQAGTVAIKPSLNVARNSCGVGILHGKMIAIGGCDGDKYLDSVEIWDPERDYEDWEEEPSLRLRSSRAGAAVVTVRNRLYCIGGYDGEGALSRMSILTKSKWTTASPMADPRRDLAAVVVGNSIYAIGGRGVSKAKDTVERYDPREKRWEIVQNLPTPRYGHSAVVINDKVCVVGGLSCSNSFALYDPRRDRWDEPLCCTVPGRRNPEPYSLAVQCAFASVAVVDLNDVK